MLCTPGSQPSPSSLPPGLHLIHSHLLQKVFLRDCSRCHSVTSSTFPCLGEGGLHLISVQHVNSTRARTLSPGTHSRPWGQWLTEAAEVTTACPLHKWAGKGTAASPPQGSGGDYIPQPRVPCSPARSTSHGPQTLRSLLLGEAPQPVGPASVTPLSAALTSCLCPHPHYKQVSVALLPRPGPPGTWHLVRQPLGALSTGGACTPQLGIQVGSPYPSELGIWVHVYCSE